MAKKRNERDEEIIELEVMKRVRARCIAFWSGVLTIMAFIGNWISNNILPVKAAAKAFWDAWGSK